MLAHQFPRRLLVAVAGLSPQVVTETLYALAVTGHPPFIPTEIHLLTTAEGADRANLSLLSQEPGWFHRLRRDYSLPPILFTSSEIHVLRDPAGVPLTDIRSSAENLAAADSILSLVRSLTSDSAAALHASLAGGRKTLGTLLAFSLSLFARAQDSLSHVLVSAPYESHPSFFYPTPRPNIIYTPPPDSRPLDTAAAHVSLAEIPFVRLRSWLDPTLLNSVTSYSRAVQLAQQSIGPEPLLLDYTRRALVVGTIPIPLPPADFAFYAWFAHRAANALDPIACPSDGAPDPGLAHDYLAHYRSIDPADTRTHSALRRGMDKDFFLQRKSRIRRALRHALGPQAALYEIAATGHRPSTRYQLALPAGLISFSQESSL